MTLIPFSEKLLSEQITAASGDLTSLINTKTTTTYVDNKVTVASGDLVSYINAQDSPKATTTYVDSKITTTSGDIVSQLSGSFAGVDFTPPSISYSRYY